MADTDEAEVAAVLFRLPDLIRKFESHRRFPPWGAKRKRSAPPMFDSPAEFLRSVNEKQLDFASSSPTSPLAFSSVADLDSKHVSFGLTQEMMKMEISDGLMAQSIKLEEEARQQQSVCSNSDSLEGQSVRRSQPLVYHHQHEEVGPTGIPDLNVPAEAEEEWEWVPQVDYNNNQHQYMAVVAAAAGSRAEAAALARQRRHLIQRSKRATRGNRCAPPLF